MLHIDKQIFLTFLLTSLARKSRHYRLKPEKTGINDLNQKSRNYLLKPEKAGITDLSQKKQTLPAQSKKKQELQT
jgi:hypothetical protein